MSRCSGGDRFGQRRKVIRKFGREQRAGHRRPHGAAHHARHPDHRPEARITGQILADQKSGTAAEDQQWGENAAGSSRAQRYQPDDGLDDQQKQHCLYEQIAIEQVLDVAVAGPQHADIEQCPPPTTTAPIAGHHIQWIGSA